MSLKTTFNSSVLFFALLGAVLAIGGRSYWKLWNQSEIQISPFKAAHLMPKTGTRTIAKANGSFEISIEPKNKKALKDGDEREFIAVIRSNREVNQLNVRWVLDGGVSHVSGPVEPTFFDLKKNDSVTVTLEIKKVGEERGLINVEAYTIENDGTRIGAVESYSTETLSSSGSDQLKPLEYQIQKASPVRIKPKVLQ